MAEEKPRGLSTKWWQRRSHGSVYQWWQRRSHWSVHQVVAVSDKVTLKLKLISMHTYKCQALGSPWGKPGYATYIHFHISPLLHTHTHMHARTHTHACTHTHTHTHAHAHTHACTRTRTHTHTHTHTHAHTRTHTHTLTHTYKRVLQLCSPRWPTRSADSLLPAQNSAPSWSEGTMHATSRPAGAAVTAHEQGLEECVWVGVGGEGV